MTRQGQLQPTAEAGTANRRHNRLRRAFHQVAQIDQAGYHIIANRGGRSHLGGGEGELADVGAGGKVGPGAAAGEDDGRDGVVVQGRAEGSGQMQTSLRAEGIDRVGPGGFGVGDVDGLDG